MSVVDRFEFDNDIQEHIRNELWTVFTDRKEDRRYKFDLSLRLKNKIPSDKINERHGAIMGMFLSDELNGWEKDKLMIELATIYVMYGYVHTTGINVNNLSKEAINEINLYLNKDGSFSSDKFHDHTKALWNNVEYIGEDKLVNVLQVLEIAYNKENIINDINNISSEESRNYLLNNITKFIYKIKTDPYNAMIGLGGIITTTGVINSLGGVNKIKNTIRNVPTTIKNKTNQFITNESTINTISTYITEGTINKLYDITSNIVDSTTGKLSYIAEDAKNKISTISNYLPNIPNMPNMPDKYETEIINGVEVELSMLKKLHNYGINNINNGGKVILNTGNDLIAISKFTGVVGATIGTIVGKKVLDTAATIGKNVFEEVTKNIITRGAHLVAPSLTRPSNIDDDYSRAFKIRAHGSDCILANYDDKDYTYSVNLNNTDPLYKREWIKNNDNQLFNISRDGSKELLYKRKYDYKLKIGYYPSTLTSDFGPTFILTEIPNLTDNNGNQLYKIIDNDNNAIYIGSCSNYTTHVNNFDKIDDSIYKKYWITEPISQNGGAISDVIKGYWDFIIQPVNADNFIVMGSVNALASRYKVSVIKSSLRAFIHKKTVNEDKCNADIMGPSDPKWKKFRGWCSLDKGECNDLLQCLADYSKTGNSSHIKSCTKALKNISNVQDAFKRAVKNTNPKLAYFILNVFGFREITEYDSIAMKDLKKIESVDQWEQRNKHYKTNEKIRMLLHFLVQFTRCNINNFTGKTEENIGIEIDKRLDKYGIYADNVKYEKHKEFVNINNTFNISEKNNNKSLQISGILHGGYMNLPTENMTLKQNYGAGLLRAVFTNIFDSLSKNGKSISNSDKQRINNKLDKLDEVQDDVMKTLRVYSTYLNITNDLRDYIPKNEVDSQKMKLIINRYKRNLDKIQRMELSLNKITNKLIL